MLIKQLKQHELKQCTGEDGEDNDAKGYQRHVKQRRDKTAMS